MKNIVVIPVDTQDGTVSELRKAGYIPIRCDDPARIALISEHSRMTGDDLLGSAMHALAKADSVSTGSSVRSDMVLELGRRIKSKEQTK